MRNLIKKTLILQKQNIQTRKHKPSKQKPYIVDGLKKLKSKTFNSFAIPFFENYNNHQNL